MGRAKIPDYEYIPSKGMYRKRLKGKDGKYHALYGKTPKELHDKVEVVDSALKQWKKLQGNKTYTESRITVEEYAKEWLKTRAEEIRATTLIDYNSIIKIYLINTIGDMYLDEVTLEDIDKVMAKAAKMSKSVYRKTRALTNAIFQHALERNKVEENPVKIVKKGLGKKGDDKDALTDEQANILLKAVEGHRVHTFIALGLYTGMRREEILGLKWDAVNLESKVPSIRVFRTWHIEHNRPVIIDETKSEAGKRIIPITHKLLDILKKSKAAYPSEYVVPNLEGGPLSGTQWGRLWKYVTVRMSYKEHYYYKKNKDGSKTKRVVIPELGQKAKHNNTCIYSIDFKVTPHVLRYTFATNLISSGVDIKTAEYLMGHSSAQMLMDVYARVKNEDVEVTAPLVEQACAKIQAFA